MGTNRDDFPEVAKMINELRHAFKIDTNPTYVEENGKCKGVKTDYSKLVEPCLNRRDK